MFWGVYNYVMKNQEIQGAMDTIFGEHGVEFEKN